MCAWNVSVLDKETMMGKLTFEIKRKMIQVAAFGYSNLYSGIWCAHGTGGLWIFMSIWIAAGTTI